MPFRDRILSGIPRKEILTYFYFLEHFNVSKITQEEPPDSLFSVDVATFHIGNCEVQVLGTNSNCLPGFVIPCTEVVFIGEKSEVEREMSKFRHKFLRGGG